MAGPEKREGHSGKQIQNHHTQLVSTSFDGVLYFF